MSETTDPQIQLVIEQIARMRDQLNARLSMLETQITHQGELNAQRLTGLAEDITRLNKCLDDHETRIRAVQDGVTGFKIVTGLGSGGSALMSLGALLKAFIGG